MKNNLLIFVKKWKHETMDKLFVKLRGYSP